MNMRSRVVPMLVGLAMCLPAVANAGSITGKVKCKGLRSNANAVVYVDEIEGVTFDAPEAHALMDQASMEFVPHVLPILVGTTVDFQNSDTVLHNVFSPDKCADKFNLGSWPQGDKRSFTFDHECASVVLCNVHPEMEGFVFTAPTPYFAVTAKDGSYEIADVPTGSYTVKVWHPKLKSAEQQVEVGEAAATADFEIKK